MLNRYVSILLLVALVSSNFSRFFVYAGFEANQSYIAKVLCENKARPWLHCNGRCYLMKKLKEADYKEKKQEREDKKNQFQEAFFVTGTDVTILPPTLADTVYSRPAPGAIVHRPASIFQPPRLS